MLRSTLVWLIFLPIFFGSFAMLPTEGRAATIALESSSASILAGALVEIRIYGIGFDDGTDGGDFALSWPSSLSFVDLAIELEQLAYEVANKHARD